MILARLLLWMTIAIAFAAMLLGGIPILLLLRHPEYTLWQVAKVVAVCGLVIWVEAMIIGHVTGEMERSGIA